jgi:thymidylate synthase (FAD)
VKFTCDRCISHEFVRHRVFSFIQESTRYCNYNKAKFGSQITYIIPQWIHDIQKNIAATIDPLTGETRKQWLDYKDDILMNMLTVEDRTVAQYIDTLQKIEDCYLDMITLDDGTKLVPQQARQILPNALKTELVMTGTIEQWEGFFKLRCDVAAHPDARYLANKLHEMFLNEGYINN